MTTKDYVRKYKFQPNGRFSSADQKSFYSDMTYELMSLLELNKANDNLAGFKNATRCLRMKFDAIGNKSYGLVQDKHWNYFFATVIAKVREQMCARELAIETAKYEERARIRADRKRVEEEMLNAFAPKVDFDFWTYFAWSMLQDQREVIECPSESFALLSLPDDADEERVTIQYRILAKKHHPDLGGDEEMFKQVAEAKFKCLEYINASKSK